MAIEDSTGKVLLRRLLVIGRSDDALFAAKTKER